jgi:tetratricopeptide (TPR) repeat protein
MTEQQLPFADENQPDDWVALEEVVRKHESKGDFGAAQIAVNDAITRARAAQNRQNKDPEALLASLEIRADFRARIGKGKDARADYLEAISLVAGQPGYEGTLGRLFGSLAYLQESLGENGEAIDAYERALEQINRMREPVVVEKVRLTNNLAFLISQQDDFDQAETLFLKALQLAHNKLGPTDEETTGVGNNVGNLYQRAGHYQQAREMHLMALEGRKKLGGEKHPDTAQSHGNLAVVYALEGNSEEAREHFEAAIKGFKALGEEYEEDLDAVASNYLQLLENRQDSKGASRVRKLLRNRK